MRTAAAAPAVPRARSPRATCRKRLWPRLVATTLPGARPREPVLEQGVSATARRARPEAPTYALCFRVRRLASATSIVRTGTPARTGEVAQLAGQLGVGHARSG